MKKNKILFALSLGAIFFLTAFTSPIFGQEENEHPAFFLALSDLKAARWLIEHCPETTWRKTKEETEAIQWIDNAIFKINMANIDDNLGINDHISVEEHPKQMERLREAIHYLNRATADVNIELDNSYADGLHDNTMGYINLAISSIDRVLNNFHPNYLAALSHLRTARWLIEQRPETATKNTFDENDAIRQIDATIEKIKNASIDDQKDIRDHDPIDELPQQIDRLNKAVDYLNKASSLISKDEDNSFAGGLRNQVLGHIHSAIGSINSASTPVHLNYLLALSNLRAARWLIDYRPETSWQKRKEEDEAIQQIDGTLNRIKSASYDDGKGISAHVPVDEHPKQIDRLKEAVEFLNKASADISNEPDNEFVGGLRNQSLQNIRVAINALNKVLGSANNPAGK